MNFYLVLWIIFCVYYYKINKNLYEIVIVFEKKECYYVNIILNLLIVSYNNDVLIWL